MFGKRLKIFKIDRINETIDMTIKTKNIQLQLVKKVGFFKEKDDFVGRCISKKFFYSVCGIADIMKFNSSNEKMLNGERFITGYTKGRLLVGE